MSLQYSVIFGRIGRSTFWSNSLVAYQETIYLADTFGMADDVLDYFNSARELVLNFEQSVIGFAASMAGQISTLTNVTNAVLGSLQKDLNAPNTQAQTILAYLYRQMVIDGQTVQRNVIDAPVITPSGSNNGNGLLKASTLNVLGITDERSLTQSVQFLCTSSQWSGGTSLAEQFSIVGYPLPSSPNLFQTQGNGNGSISVADSQNLLSNGNFETWNVADTPTSWTIVAGVAGVTIKENTALPHNGLAALSYTGNGVATTVTISQNISGQVNSNVVYALGVWVRKSGTVNAGSTLTINITGTGVTTQTVLAIDPNTLTTSYVLHWVFFATQSIVPPSDYAVNIAWTAANTAGASAVILVDDIVLVRPTVYGSVQYAIFGGSTGFAVNDSIFSVTNVSSVGVFQTYFGRWFNFQLPSSATPSISDSLATALS
jgi:hypothetical protein